MNDETTNAPAGWYPTPSGERRYWDGTAWLDIPDPDQPAPAAAAAPPPSEVLPTAPPATTTSDLPAKSGSQRGLAAILVLVLVAAAIIVWISTRGSGSSPSSTLPTLTSTTHEVVYLVTGSTTQADLTYQVGSKQSQQSGVDVPVTSTSGSTGLRFIAGSGDFLYLSAQNTQDSGTIGCEILVDGQSVASNESSGGYTITTCSGRVP